MSKQVTQREFIIHVDRPEQSKSSDRNKFHDTTKLVRFHETPDDDTLLTPTGTGIE